MATILHYHRTLFSIVDLLNMNNPRSKIKNQFKLIIVSFYFSLILLFGIINNQVQQTNNQKVDSIENSIKKSPNNSFSTNNPLIWLLLTYSLAGMPLLLFTLFIVNKKTQSITSSLSTAMNSLDEISVGNFDFKLDNIHKDETSQFLEALQTASNKLRSFVLPMEDGIQTLSTPLKELTNFSQQCNQTASAQAQLSDEINLMIDNLKNTSVPSTDTDELGNDEKNKEIYDKIEAIRQSLQMTTSIVTDIDQVSKVITELQISSETIGPVVDSINQIANQTNMLALNASIEAARAGEQGRGFAVVADEVRDLSQKTHDATTQIQEMISKIQSDTNHAVQAMDKTKINVSSDVIKPSDSIDSLQIFIDSVLKRKHIKPQHNSFSDFDVIQQSIQQLVVSSLNIEKLTTDIIAQSEALKNPINELTGTVSAFKSARKFSISESNNNV